MGRPPIGKVAMTSAERVRRYRIKHPVTKVTKSLEQARHAYVASLPTDHEARRKELVALARALEGLITMDEARRFTEEVDSIDYLVKEAAAPEVTKRKERDLARKITATLAANQPDQAIKHVNESEPAAETIPASSVPAPVTEMKLKWNVSMAGKRWSAFPGLDQECFYRVEKTRGSLFAKGRKSTAASTRIWEHISS